jgi:hypothetical protein
MGVLISPRRRGKTVFCLLAFTGWRTVEDGKRGDNDAERTEIAVLHSQSDGDGFLGVGYFCGGLECHCKFNH